MRCEDPDRRHYSVRADDVKPHSFSSFDLVIACGFFWVLQVRLFVEFFGGLICRSLLGGFWWFNFRVEGTLRRSFGVGIVDDLWLRLRALPAGRTTCFFAEELGELSSSNLGSAGTCLTSAFSSSRVMVSRQGPGTCGGFL